MWLHGIYPRSIDKYMLYLQSARENNRPMHMHVFDERDEAW